MDNLEECWEWDRITGDAVFPHPPRVLNWRYIPSVAEMSGSGLVNRNIVIDPVQAAALVRFMHSDEMRTFFTFDVTMNSLHVMSFMKLVRALNLKKVAVRYHGSGRLQMDKLNRDEPFTGDENELWNETVWNVPDLQRDINRNAHVGFVGPGTFPCHHPRCELCARTGRSATVQLGQHGVLRLTKRATCSMLNVVYVCVCSRCEELGGDDDWCVYFGETGQPLHTRCRQHMKEPCNSASILKQHRFRTAAARIAKLQRVLEGLDEEEGILRDWYSHICAGGIHEGCQRLSAVDILPLHVARIHRETGLVLQHMMRDGAIDYRGNGRGCLNTYSDNRD